MEIFASFAKENSVEYGEYSQSDVEVAASESKLGNKFTFLQHLYTVLTRKKTMNSTQCNTGGESAIILLLLQINLHRSKAASADNKAIKKDHVFLLRILFTIFPLFHTAQYFYCTEISLKLELIKIQLSAYLIHVSQSIVSISGSDANVHHMLWDSSKVNERRGFFLIIY